MNPQVQEIMIILGEECAEVIQALSKCFRFGLTELKPNTQQTNTQHLEEELGDMMAMIQLLIDAKVVDAESIEFAKQRKIVKLQKWSNIFKKD